jgi:hypothetical protein
MCSDPKMGPLPVQGGSLLSSLIKWNLFAHKHVLWRGVMNWSVLIQQLMCISTAHEGWSQISGTEFFMGKIDINASVHSIVYYHPRN